MIGLTRAMERFPDVQLTRQYGVPDELAPRGLPVQDATVDLIASAPHFNYAHHRVAQKLIESLNPNAGLTRDGRNDSPFGPDSRFDVHQAFADLVAIPKLEVHRAYLLERLVEVKNRQLGDRAQEVFTKAAQAKNLSVSDVNQVWGVLGEPTWGGDDRSDRVESWLR